MKGGTNKEGNGLRGLKYEGKQMDGSTKKRRDWRKDRKPGWGGAEGKEERRRRGGVKERVMKQGGWKEIK